jgi:hypothetical protein
MKSSNRGRIWSAVVVLLALQNFFIGSMEGVTIDFDTFPNGTPVPEGTIITDQYASVGVIFSIAISFNPPSGLVIEGVSGSFTFVGMSPPNVLTSHGHVPGPGGSLGCGADLKITFIDPSTRLPATVSSASILVFAVASNPPTTVHLVALDLNGAIVAQDEFTIPTSFGTISSFTLSVSAPGTGIASVETQGVAANIVCAAFDNLVFTPKHISENRCPLGQGFWKNHPDAWPVTSLTLGSQTYSQAELLNLLNMPVRGDASLILAYQLIAAKLNIAHGADPTPVSATITDADSLLSGFTGKLPYKITPSSSIGQRMVNDATVLDSYNNGNLTPDCQP